MSEWIDHDGKSMPVPPDTLVHVRFADGSDDVHMDPERAIWWGAIREIGTENEEYLHEISNWHWPPEGPVSNCIVAYRIWSA